jgi:phosphoribosylformylglycinamidine (FGAM) synthase PurS component
MIFEAAIDLSITDNTAYTVLVALKQLGFDALQRVERSDLYRLTLSDEQPPEQVARALMRAEIVFNPNKHRLSYIAETPGANADSGEEWEAVVADRDDDTTRLRNLLVDRFGMRGLTNIERSTAWRLYEGDGPATKERLDWACRTLLSNPHSQYATVRARPQRACAGESKAFVER